MADVLGGIQAQAHSQQNHQQHSQPHGQSSVHNGGVGNHLNGSTGGGAGMFKNLQQSSVASNFNQQQFGGQIANQGLPDNSGNQSMVGQNVQGIMNDLNMLQQKIQQLQALVPLIAQTGHMQGNNNVVIAQQQAAGAAVAGIISQLAMTATGLIPQQFQAQAKQATDLNLAQLLQAAVSPGLNLFQQSGFGSPLGTALGNTMLGNSAGNNFSTPGGVGAGTATASSGGGGTNLANGGPGFPNGGGGGPSGLGTDGELSGQQQPISGLQGGGGGSPSGGMLRKQMAGSSAKPLANALGGGGGNSIPNVAGSSLGGGGGSNSLVAHEAGGINSGFEDLDTNSRADEEDGEGENLPPGSYDLVEMDAMEILAEHTHFCEICGKGFKRDANLRMHMRGHGDEYKTPAALARPDRAAQDPAVIRPRRYSCPYVGCKRNKKHRKFLPLKTMLCVKNHYRRSHCPKGLTCQKCKAKKFSVMADLKTHEKHCGRDKWQCSCGTTFSRKDKLFGHIGLFAGHTPAMPLHEMERGSSGMESAMSPVGEAFGSGNSNGAGYLPNSGNVGNFGSSGGSGVGSGNGLEMGLGSGHGGMGLGMGSRGGSGGLTLSDEGGPGLSGNDASPQSSTFNQNLPGSSMLHELFTDNYLQGSSLGDQSSQSAIGVVGRVINNDEQI